MAYYPYSVNIGREWVKPMEFGSGVAGADPPVDGDARCVALGLVGGDLVQGRRQRKQEMSMTTN